MKKFIGVFLAIILIISQSTLVFADKNGANLNLKCKSAVLMDVTSGKVLYEKNCHEKLPPASVTKVMTMLLICEAVESNKIKLTDEVTVSETASSMGGSQIFLEPNETQTVDTLLKGIAVASANDACVAMAEYIGGSIEGFVDMMNNKAKELGMKDTNFVNTNGLPVDNHYTSAYDIALMSRELLKHEMIEKYLTTWMDKVVVGKKQATIGLANTNKMIKYYNGATGVKTGFTGEAKYCVSASAKRGKTHLVSVVLRGETSQERFKDASTLLDYGFANYESVKICSKDQKLYTLKMRKADSEQIDLVAKDDLGILIKKGESKNFTKKIKVNEDIKLPVKKGSVLGKAMIYQDGKLIDEVELVNNKDIEKSDIRKTELFWDEIMMEHALFIRGLLDPSENELIVKSNKFANEFEKLIKRAESITDDKEQFADIAKDYLTARNCFYIGRHVDYYVALEASLKLKEISYIQTEGFAAGELKHGTIALIEKGTPVIAIVSQESVNLNTRSNVKEVKARGANTVVISLKSLSSETDQIVIDDVHPLLTPLVTVVPTQLISYYAALQRGFDIDKPRNLAKSVTVE